MSDKWRILEVRKGEHVHYKMQTRLFGCLWWYNPDNIDATTTGCFNTKDECLAAIVDKRTHRKKTIISVE